MRSAIDFREEASVWRRLIAAVSLKPFVRWMAPDTVRGRTPSAVRSERRSPASHL